MLGPPSGERREVSHPSLLPVPDHSSLSVSTTSDNYCISNGVRDGACLAVINNVTNILITLLPVTLLPCFMFKGEAWLLGTVRCYQSSTPCTTPRTP